MGEVARASALPRWATRSWKPVDRAVRSPPFARTEGPRRFRQCGLSKDRAAASAREGERAVRPPNRASSASASLTSCLNTKVHCRRELFILVCLDVDAIAVFAPDEGAALMRSVVHGFGWDRRRDRHSVFGHRCLCKSPRLSRRMQRRVNCARHARANSPELARAYADYQVAEPLKRVHCRISPI